MARNFVLSSRRVLTPEQHNADRCSCLSYFIDTFIDLQRLSGLLVRWRHGDKEALQALLPMVYDELRRIAHHHLQAERGGHTLQSTALVHEAFLRLVEQEPLRLDNRAHFLAVASHLMRQILVDYARKHRAAKRGANSLTLALNEAVASFNKRELRLVALDDALNVLATLDERQSHIVELRFFGGLSIDETSQVLGVSPATVAREWTAARAWLYREMDRAAKL
jgi:RNA polymerase sigma factor (TIGR02999 family)